jgi:N-acetylmuramoyl-L-alanine amidase
MCFNSLISKRFSSMLLLICLIWLAGTVLGEAARFTTVVIDPGHGGKDKGAYWGGVRESHLNMAVARDLEGMLKRQGIRTVVTRRSDVFVSIPRRAAIGNAQRNAVMVSIHFNASLATQVRGAETFYWGAQGAVLARAIQRRLAPGVGTVNRGIRRKGFTLIVQSKHPTVLVECGFISNPTERGRCNTRSYQQAAARAIFQGLMAYRALR